MMPIRCSTAETRTDGSGCFRLSSSDVSESPRICRETHKDRTGLRLIQRTEAADAGRSESGRLTWYFPLLIDRDRNWWKRRFRSELPTSVT